MGSHDRPYQSIKEERVKLESILTLYNIERKREKIPLSSIRRIENPVYEDRNPRERLILKGNGNVTNHLVFVTSVYFFSLEWGRGLPPKRKRASLGRFRHQTRVNTRDNGQNASKRTHFVPKTGSLEPKMAQNGKGDLGLQERGRTRLLL